MKFTLRGLGWAALSLAVLGFIFGNSLQTAPESSALSGAVLDLFDPLLGHSSRSEEELAHILRKLAHFAEFSLLGLSLCGTAHGFSLPRPRLSAAACGILAAAADEFLQRFAEGRSPQLTDVMLDSAGVLFGLCLWMLLRCIVRRHTDSAA